MKKFTMLFVCFLLLGIHIANAQKKTITGTVISSDDGMGLPGVSVSVKGTTIGTITNVQGEYSLSVPEDAQTLVFSFVGMASQEVGIGNATVIDVTMEPETIGVDEVVVTALGIKRSEKAIGYSATNVSKEMIEESMSSDVMNAVSGRVAGVQVQNSGGGPGSSNSVIIRGMSSLSDGNNQPLYVIDGIPIDNSANTSDDELNRGFDFGNGANMINPDDVESMTILKGAAATALYGSRAANGVIMVTTKSGKARKGIGVTFTTGAEVADILRLPQFQNTYGMGWSGEHTMIENGSWGPEMDGSMQLWGRVYNNSQKLKPYAAQPDNVRDFFEYGYQYNNSLTLTGGNEKTTFFASLSQVSSDGLVPSDVDTYDKYTMRVNASHKATDKLEVSAGVSLAHQENQFSLTGQGLTMINSLYQIPRDISIIGLEDYENDPFNSLDYYFTPYGVTNPYFLIDKKENNYKRDKIVNKIQVDYSIFDNLKATYRLGADISNGITKMGNPEIKATPGTPNEAEIDEPGQVFTSSDRRVEMNHDIMLQYNKELIAGLDLNATAGFNANERTRRYQEAEVNGLDLPYFYNLGNSPSTPNIDEETEMRRLFGVYGQIEAAYNNLLFLTLSARNDKSSTLPKENNSFFYPGVALSFNFSEILPETVTSVVDFGKVRLAYGKTGNDADPYVVYPTFESAEVYNEFGDMWFPFNGVNAYERSNRLGSLNLSPEMSREMEVGLRMDFFKGRAGFDVAYYDKISDKQIFDIDLDPATGFTSQTANIGEISNKGIELLVNVTPVKTRDFKWDMTFNYGKNKNELLSLPEELGGDQGEVNFYGFGTSGARTDLIARVGEPVGQFKVTVPERDPNGNIVVNPETGKPVAATENEVVGDMNYDFTMGITNTLKYKGVSLAFNFDIRKGGIMYSRTKDILYFTGNAIQTVDNERQTYLVPNSVNKIDNGDGTYSYQENSTPITKEDMWEYYQDGLNELSEQFLIDKSFVKLRFVSLGYELPSSFLNQINVAKAKISIYGNNVFLWTPEDNTFIDPEVSTFGNDLVGQFGEYSVNPSTRNFGIKLQLTF